MRSRSKMLIIGLVLFAAGVALWLGSGTIIHWLMAMHGGH